MKRKQLFIRAIVLCIGIYIATVSLSSLYVYGNAQALLQDLRGHNDERVDMYSGRIRNGLSILRITIPFLSPQIQKAERVMDVLQKDVNNLSKLEEMQEGMLNGTSFISTYPEIKNFSYDLLNSLSELIISVKKNIVFYTFWQKAEKAQTAVRDAQDVIPFLDFFFDPAYAYGDKLYLVLLQNNMELRPTGGFLGSYMRIHVSNGAIVDIRVEDIYVPDGALIGYVEPPMPVKEYLFQGGGWKLRDSNWNPDFPLSAQSVKWFYEQATQEHIDGIIATNFTVVEQLLKDIGSIELSDYNQVITPENMYSFVQVETEHEFFPGSTNKTAVLGSMWRAMKTTVNDLPMEKKLALLHTFTESLRNGETLLWFENEYTQKRVLSKDWDGSVKSEKAVCNEDNCVTQYIFPVEANVGINKTNCCLQRKAVYDVEVGDDGSLYSSLRLEYINNNEKKPNPPYTYGGGYKNFLRIYTDTSSILRSVIVNGKEVPSDALLEESYENITGYGFLSHVDGKTSGSVEVSYVRNTAFDPKKISTYTLFIQKQPGLTTNDYEVRIRLPESLVFADGSREQNMNVYVNKSMGLEFALYPKEKQE